MFHLYSFQDYDIIRVDHLPGPKPITVSSETSTMNQIPEINDLSPLESEIPETSNKVREGSKMGVPRCFVAIVCFVRLVTFSQVK